jgi:hypothetical protein
MSFRDRLREAEFIAPSGNSIKFNVDTLIREGGKKGGVQEILDSDQTVGQDQGNITYTFPITAYFTGQNYDQEIDTFVRYLEERYTRAFPGTLVHPRWGNKDVFPFSWTQREELIDKIQYGILEISFREISIPLFPLAIFELLDRINEILLAINRATSVLASLTDLSTSTLISAFVDRIRTAQSLVSGAVANIGRAQEGITDSINNINDAIDTAIDGLPATVSDVLTGTQELIRLATTAPSANTDKTAAYALLTEELFEIFVDPTVVDTREEINNAILLETVSGFSVASTCEAGANTDFTIAKDAITVVDVISNLFENYKLRLEETKVDGNVTNEYSGDHNLTSLYFDIVTNSNAYILNNAFELKTERKFVFNFKTDIITICKDQYNSVTEEILEFFILTNKIIDDEFIEIPAGREVVVYV